MNVSLIKLYELLKANLGEQGAEDLTQYIEAKIVAEVATQSHTLATSNDLTLVREDVAVVRRDIAKSNANMITWMFLFWIFQLAATFGLLKYFIDK